MGKDIAVVILNWNGADMLRRFLPSVVSNSTEADVVVADNGSTDNSCEVIEKEFPTVQLLRLEKNYGFAEGYNRALDKITATYSVLLNSDVEVTAHWLEPLHSFMEEHLGLSACQPKILSYANKKQFEYAGACGGYMDYLGYPFCRGRMLDTVEDDNGQYENIRSIFWASGAALMIRTELYKEVGGLDARFFAHMEEIDLCWRLGSRGYGIVCIPQSVVYHLGAGTLKKESPQKTFLNFRNNLLMIYKNMTSKRLYRVLIIRTFLDAIAATKFLFTGQRSHAWAVVRAHCTFYCMRPSFKADRKQNHWAAVTNPLGLTFNSLLFTYYFKRKHTFSVWDPF